MHCVPFLAYRSVNFQVVISKTACNINSKFILFVFVGLSNKIQYKVHYRKKNLKVFQLCIQNRRSAGPNIDTCSYCVSPSKLQVTSGKAKSIWMQYKRRCVTRTHFSTDFFSFSFKVSTVNITTPNLVLLQQIDTRTGELHLGHATGGRRHKCGPPGCQA